MSIKEEKFIILDDVDDDVTSRLLITEVVGNAMLLNDNRDCGMGKNDICVQSDKNYDAGLIKKELSLSDIRKVLKKPEDASEYLAEFSYNCSVCQNICNNCKNICVTCKFPCRKCTSESCKSASTDTDDFEKYLESQSKKIKVQLKVKTVGTDTCDLEGHFDYYKLEKKTVRIQKHVATDCADLILRKAVFKKPNKKSIAIDTSDLGDYYREDCNDESDCEFFWNKKEETKTYFKKPNLEKTFLKKEERHCDEDDISENSLVIDEDVSSFPAKDEEENKENCKTDANIKDITFEESSSDESDIDLATSCKLLKCRQLAKKHKITLKQISSEKEVSYGCSICSKTFQKKSVGVLHLGSHVEDNLVKCLSCGEKFTSIDVLFAHIKELHKGNSAVESGHKDMSGSSENLGGEMCKQKANKTYQCMLCPTEGEEAVQFDSSKALWLHKKEKHNIERTRVSESETKTEKKPRIRREFICLICGKQFKSSKALKDHSPVHTGEKNYHCDICKKSYTTSANLKIHKRTHTGTRNFVCTVCGKAFHKKDSLKVHFRKHSGERPFQCDLCPMKFDRNYILKNHRYTHFSEKTFICPVCGKTFTTHGGLNNHEKGHKKDPFAKKPRKPAVKPTLDAENAVICDVCGKIYSTRSNLRIHKFVHLGVKPFECTICHQTYAKKDSMLTHMRKHTDERPFACETCGMTFYRNHTLKTHLLRHTGERPHKCKMCGKSFTQSSSLAYHVKNHDRKVEKKKAAGDPTKVKKKRATPGGKSGVSGGSKKVQKGIKSPTEYPSENLKPLFEEKKPADGPSEMTVLKDPLSLPDKGTGDLTKGGHFTLPVPVTIPGEKEILILDKSLGVELPRAVNPGKEVDFFGLDKDISYGNQYNPGKFNYYIAKSHIFSLPKETLKSKSGSKEIEISIDKNEEDVENLIISKSSYITKEGNLVTLNRESSLKEAKEEFVQIGDQRLDLKAQPGIPITGEILNAAFISDENGDVIPLGSMTLQGLSGENVMISPLVPVESDDRKGFLRNSKLTMLDSKITYNLAGSRMPTEKSQGKGNYHVISLKDARAPQKIQLDLEPAALQIQGPVVDDGTLHGMTGFYSSVQQNEM